MHQLKTFCMTQSSVQTRPGSQLLLQQVALLLLVNSKTPGLWQQHCDKHKSDNEVT
jgi:hypothetical protein